MSEPQLERSVLEAKEREELFAIANALGTRPTSRARKSDLVSQILQATGVEEAPSEEARPRRTRARKPAGLAAGGGEQLPLGEAGDDLAPRPAAPAASAAPAVDEAAGVATTGEASGSTRERGVDASPGRGAEPQELSAPEAGTGQPPVPGGARAGGARPAEAHPARNEVPRRDGRAEGPMQAAGPAPRSGPAPTGPVAGAEEGAEAGSDGEPGNRRSRRRRGRDRTERVERDLPGQAPEQPFSGEPVPVSGLFDLREEGYGFLRTTGPVPGPTDVYVSISQVRRFALRRGDRIDGAARPAGGNEKYPALVRVDTVGGRSPEEARGRPRFEDLTPVFPDRRLHLELAGDAGDLTGRAVDLLAPIARGQRALVVSPPMAGRTTVLKQIARSIEANHPDVVLVVVLVDERPEEVTDMRRSIGGEVVASTFDRPAEEHVLVAELTVERAKRVVELGRDVVVVLDGITRLARAYNLAQPAGGRIVPGGIDAAALHAPKKLFGAARNLEEGGSLTIVATASVGTGSPLDEAVLEELEGTANMELRLDRSLAERRLHPAIDVEGSSTRHEELLFERDQLQQVWKLRGELVALGAGGDHAAGYEALLDRLRATQSNEELLADLAGDRP